MFDVDPLRWPFTSQFLHTHRKELEARARIAPTLAWAYGAALDKAEDDRMRWLPQVRKVVFE